MKKTLKNKLKRSRLYLALMVLLGRPVMYNMYIDGDRIVIKDFRTSIINCTLYDIEITT